MMEQRILDFIDGNLGVSDEEELLHTLAVSPERRSLLKQHLKLREFAGALGALPALTVPHATTASLFDRLSTEGFQGAAPIPVGFPTASMPLGAALSPAALSAVGTTTSIGAAKILAYSAGLVAAFLLGIWLNASVGNNTSSSSTNQTTAESSRFVTANTGVLQPKSSASESSVSEVTADNRTGANSSGAYSSGEKLSGEKISGENRASANQTIFTSTRARRANELTSIVSGSEPATVQPQNRAVSENTTDQALPRIPTDVYGKSSHAPFIGTLFTPSGKDFAMNVAQARIRPFDESLRETSNESRLTFAMRTGAGPGPTLGLGYINSLSEAKISWKATNWLSLKASLGELETYETQAVNRGSSAGVTIIATQPSLNFSTIGSFELGFNQTVFGLPLELAAGVGANQSGLLYPRGSLFGSIVLGSGMMLNMGVEGMTYIHDVTSSVRAKEQSLIGNNPAVLQHTSSERLGFFGPALEFSWQP